MSGNDENCMSVSFKISQCLDNDLMLTKQTTLRTFFERRHTIRVVILARF